MHYEVQVLIVTNTRNTSKVLSTSSLIQMMEKENINKICGLTDAEFISYLYSERERENSLNQVHGWNNWALAGAIATVVCASYSIFKSAGSLNSTHFLYYTSGLLAIIWNYLSWAFIFKRNRGIDYGRVRVLKDVFPQVDFWMKLLSFISLPFFIIRDHGMDSIAWWWIGVAFWYVSVRVMAHFQRNEIVSSWYDRAYLPLSWQNIIHELLSCLFFSFIIAVSFKTIPGHIICSEFEMAICVTALYVLLYVLFKINVDNPAAKQFDAIIDDYLYKGVSKEATYQKILINRMGYGVIEVCNDAINSINESLKDYSSFEQKILIIKDNITRDDITQKEFETYFKDLDSSIAYLNKLIREAKKLKDRINKIFECAPGLTDIDSLDKVINTNEMILEKIEKLSNMLSDAITNVRESKRPYLCQKYGGLCFNMECEARNDKMSMMTRFKIRCGGLLKHKRLLDKELIS